MSSRALLLVAIVASACSSVRPLKGDTFVLNIPANMQDIAPAILDGCAMWASEGVRCATGSGDGSLRFIRWEGCGELVGLTTPGMRGSNGGWTALASGCEPGYISLVVMHELGHWVGLGHVMDLDVPSVMHPIIENNAPALTAADHAALVSLGIAD